MKFSNYDVHVISKELDSILSDGKIGNVYGIEDLLMLKISTISSGNKNLIIKDDSRINITEYDYPIPKYPTQFIQSLRKVLKNRKILSVSQYKFDRVIIFELSNFGKDSWQLIIELFNKGNYILIDESNIVKVAKIYRKFRDRDILANREYSFPQSRGESFLSLREEDFEDVIQNSDGEVIRVLARYISFSGLYSEEICFRAKIDKTKKANELKEFEIHELYKNFKNLRNEILFGNINAQIVFGEDGNQINVLPIDLEIYNNFEKKYFDSFNKAVDEFYSKLDSESIKQPFDAKINQKLSELNKILKRQREYLEELKEEKKKRYSYGEFIYSHLNSLERLFSVIQSAKTKGYNYYEINEKLKDAKNENVNGLKLFLKIEPTSRNIYIKIYDDEVILDLDLSVGENANNLYNKGKKTEKKIEGTIQAISETISKIKKLKTTKSEMEEEVDFLIKPPKKKWYEKYRWFISSDNFLVIGGKDASSNESIFRKHLEKFDVVFHTDIPGSPLVIIKNPNNETIPEKTIQEAAEFVASYSRAWKESWGVIDVFYVDSEQVSKTPPSGEFLPRGSFMISGKKNFVKNSKIQLAVTTEYIKVEEEDREEIYYPKIIIGPLSAIKSKYQKYMIIKPSKSGLSKGNLAKKIRNTFINNSIKEKEKWIKILSLDDIINVLPSGTSKLKMQ
jgi:predicted ribosome quality control (RQC) complex YloA/Tae2 family protein